MEINEMYNLADKIYATFRIKSGDDAIEIVNHNRKMHEDAGNESMVFVWDVIRCKVDTETKKRLQK